MRIGMIFGATCALLLASAAGAGAGRFRASAVPAGANWVVHADVAELRNTGVGNHILGELQTERMNRKFTAFQAVFGFDPRADVDDMTLFGEGADGKRAAALFRGRFDAERLVTLIRASDGYQEHVHGQHAVHEWVDEKDGKTRFGAVHEDGTIVVSESGNTVGRALDVLDGASEGLDRSGPLSSLIPSMNGVFFMAAADLSRMHEAQPNAAVLRNADAAQLVLEEVGGNLQGSLVLSATTEENAVNIENAARGMVAFAALAGDDNPELARLAGQTRVARNAVSVTVSMDYPVSDVIDCLRKHATENKSDAGANAPGD